MSWGRERDLLPFILTEHRKHHMKLTIRTLACIALPDSNPSSVLPCEVSLVLPSSPFQPPVRERMGCVVREITSSVFIPRECQRDKRPFTQASGFLSPHPEKTFDFHHLPSAHANFNIS
eukprot:758232-Hanusia_phi.AAC.8